VKKKKKKKKKEDMGAGEGGGTISREVKTGAKEGDENGDSASRAAWVGVGMKTTIDDKRPQPKKEIEKKGGRERSIPMFKELERKLLGFQEVQKWGGVGKKEQERRKRGW